MQNREIKVVEFIDKNGNFPNQPFKIYAYLTGKENRDYQTLLMSAVKVEGEDVSAGNIKPELFFKAQDFLINTLLVEAPEGSSKVDFILNSPKPVSDFILSEIAKIAGVEEKKKG
jgi:hypothetical protein